MTPDLGHTSPTPISILSRSVGMQEFLATAMLSLVVIMQVGTMYELSRIRARYQAAAKRRG